MKQILCCVTKSSWIASKPLVSRNDNPTEMASSRVLLKEGRGDPEKSTRFFKSVTSSIFLGVIVLMCALVFNTAQGASDDRPSALSRIYTTAKNDPVGVAAFITTVVPPIVTVGATLGTSDVSECLTYGVTFFASYIMATFMNNWTKTPVLRTINRYLLLCTFIPVIAVFLNYVRNISINSYYTKDGMFSLTDPRTLPVLHCNTNEPARLDWCDEQGARTLVTVSGQPLGGGLYAPFRLPIPMPGCFSKAFETFLIHFKESCLCPAFREALGMNQEGPCTFLDDPTLCNPSALSSYVTAEIPFENLTDCRTSKLVYMPGPSILDYFPCFQFYREF